MEEKIDYILGNFDFERVRKVMTYLNWTWKTENSCYVPNYYNLIDTSRRLLEKAYKGAIENETDWARGTGGFMARAKYLEGKINLSLEFILTGYSN